MMTEVLSRDMPVRDDAPDLRAERPMANPTPEPMVVTPDVTQPGGAPDTAATSQQPIPAAPAKRRNWLRLLLMISVPLLLFAIGGYWWMTGGDSVSTDNAYVQQDKVSVSSEIGGRIVEVAVVENQQVKAGDLLFRLDPEPYRIAVAQANAEIAGAEAHVTALRTTAATTGGDIVAAREAVAFAAANLDREQQLMARGFNTRARVDAARNALAQARGQLASANAAAARANSELATGATVPGIDPGILAGRTRREQALYNLSRTEVRAPVDGVVSQADRLQVGQTMVAGLPAVSVVATGHTWIEANFKETDLDRMRVGQRATLTFDAYPGLEVEGRVASIGAGTGSEFSVLPAQNATGNWVKVTQRVPVRIAITGRPSRPMIAGLSTEVIVHFDPKR